MVYKELVGLVMEHLEARLEVKNMAVMARTSGGWDSEREWIEKGG